MDTPLPFKNVGTLLVLLLIAVDSQMSNGKVIRKQCIAKEKNSGRKWKSADLKPKERSIFTKSNNCQYCASGSS